MPKPWSLLYLPNEVVEGDQVGPRDAFEGMLRDGVLSRYEAFSYLVEAQRHGAEQALVQLLDRVRAHPPQVLLWQHVSNFPVDTQWLRRLREAAPNMHLLYHEADAYGRWVKRLPRGTRQMMAAADTVALVGRGELAKLARSAGARRVLYSPHSADTRRFGQPWEPTRQRDFDVIMIGNCIRSRLPWGRMPGAASRVAMVRALGRRFGQRFAVYGAGWDGFIGNQGRLDFAHQEIAQRRAWLTVSWDHFDGYDSYFSDRVPISMMSGVPHVTNHQPGYEQVFGDDPPLQWARGVDEMVAQVEQMLTRGPQSLIDLGQRAQHYARERFTARPVYQRLLSEAMEA
jgi:hypothetical protein